MAYWYFDYYHSRKTPAEFFQNNDNSIVFRMYCEEILNSILKKKQVPKQQALKYFFNDKDEEMKELFQKFVIIIKEVEDFFSLMIPFPMQKIENIVNHLNAHININMVGRHMSPFNQTTIDQGIEFIRSANKKKIATHVIETSYNFYRTCPENLSDISIKSTIEDVFKRNIQLIAETFSDDLD
jgi:hypothetical protein